VVDFWYGRSTPLIFLHNFGGGFRLRVVYPAFATNYRVLAPDLIGWGESAHPVRDYKLLTMTTLAEFIQQTCRSPVAVWRLLTAALSIRLAFNNPIYFKHCRCVQLGLTTLGRVLGADSAAGD